MAGDLLTLAPSLWQNPLDPLDANGDGQVTALDALVVANQLQIRGPGTLETVALKGVDPQAAGPGGDGVLYVDTNGDGQLTPEDFDAVASYLNAAETRGVSNPSSAATGSEHLAEEASGAGAKDGSGEAESSMMSAYGGSGSGSGSGSGGGENTAPYFYGGGSGSGSGSPIVWNGQTHTIWFDAIDDEGNLDRVEVTGFDHHVVTGWDLDYESNGDWATGTVTLHFHGNVHGSAWVELTVYDTEGLTDVIQHSVDVYDISGWTAQERPWGSENWGIPQDLNVLWTDNANRWRVTTNPPEILYTDQRLELLWVDWYRMPWSIYEQKDQAYREDLSNWFGGPPGGVGDFMVMPRIEGISWQGDVERYFITALSSVQWIPVANLGTEQEVVNPGTAEETVYSLARLQICPGCDEGSVWPQETGPDPFVTVRVQVTINPALPADFPGTPTVHVAWYDPDNTLGNVPSQPPAINGHGLRDNKVGSDLSVETPTLEFDASDNGTKTSYHMISGSRFGDNFIVAVHPNQGVETSYEFRPLDSGGSGSGSGSSSGSGSGGGVAQEPVLQYRDLLEVGSGSGSGQPQYEEDWNQLPDQYRTFNLTIFPSVDIDTDSDNTGTVERSIEEELLEEQAPGKRLFINHNDTNRNGIPDKDEMFDGVPAIYDEDDKDLVEAILDFGLSTYEGLEGFKLVLSYPDNIDVWWTQTRIPLTDFCADHDAENRTFAWTITEHWDNYAINPFPVSVYIEGTGINSDNTAKSGVVSWTISSPPEVFAASFADHALFTVEPIVWPDGAAEFDRQALLTHEWPGFMLAEGWYIEKSLEELINSGPGQQGDIRTHYPSWHENVERSLPDPPGGTIQFDALLGTLHEHQDAKSTTKFDGIGEGGFLHGFDMTLHFEFDGPSFVDVDHSTSPSPNFFRNSGVYCFNKYEIQIFDTNAILDALVDPNDPDQHFLPVEFAGDQVLVGGILDAEGDVKLHHHYGPNDLQWDWESQPADGLITGIPYKQREDLRNYLGLTTGGSWLIPGITNVMQISFTPDPGGGDPYIFVVLNGVFTHGGTVPVTGRHSQDPTKLIHLQSHWGSGVKFTEIQVTAKEAP